MKALFISISAIALLAASPVQAGDTWTGPFIGLHAGYAWGDASTTDNIKDGVRPGPFDYSPDGVVVGGTAGWNFQIDRFVVGVEGDLSYLDLSGSGIIPSDSSSHQTLTLDGGLYGDITARAGFLVTPDTLLYGKGGFAFYTGEAKQTSANPAYSQQGTSTFTGWTAGAGIEQRLTDALSIKVEWMHTDFGDEGGSQTSISDPPIGHVYKNDTSLDMDSVRVGLNWHFN
jgi:outer membrane immunogenic protein